MRLADRRVKGMEADRKLSRKFANGASGSWPWRATGSPFRWRFWRMINFLYELRCPDDRMLYRLYVRYPRVFWHEAIAELNQV